MSLDPYAARLLRMLSVQTAATEAGVDAPARRADLVRLAEAAADREPLVQVPFSAGAAGEAARLGITLIDRDDGPSRPVRLYRPEPSGDAAVLYLHGGGWVAGGLDTHDGVCRRLAAGSACSVAALDYRLAPEHPFPAALDDVLDALRWIGAGGLGPEVDPAKIVLAGDSAGANLAAAAALLCRDEGPRAPALLLLICPILDLAEERLSRKLYGRGHLLDEGQLARDLHAYAPGADRRDPRLSPLQAPSFFGMPPTLLHSAEYDPFRDEAGAFAAALRAGGTACVHTVHPGMIHYFYALGGAIPAARRALDGIASEIRAFMGD